MIINISLMTSKNLLYREQARSTSPLLINVQYETGVKSGFKAVNDEHPPLTA